MRQKKALIFGEIFRRKLVISIYNLDKKEYDKI